MNNVKVLDCTLRDGGYINNWAFGEREIKGIISQLEAADIDIIETGFLRPEEHVKESSIFSDTKQIERYICKKKEGIQYAVMIESRNYKNLSLSKYDGNSIDIIRITFRKNEWQEAKENIKDIIAKGYKVCIQPVGSALYDDQSMINLIKDVNEIKPYAFYLVDTLGVMYRDDMRKFFYLIDNNLSNDILLGYHSHNNLQMAFANAQEMTRLNKHRAIIIDAACYGMGRGVGNLATELIADYINNNIQQKYSLTPILNIVDKYLMPIYASQRWGYDLPYFLSASKKCHPNYAAYLMGKETLNIESIEKILSLIPLGSRNEYDAKLIDALYHKMQSFDYEDSNSYEVFSQDVGGKEVLILGPGTSIVSYKNVVQEKSMNRVVIATNFVPSDYRIDALFISNEKRLNSFNELQVEKVLATSNLKDDFNADLFFNYSSLLGEGDASDNAGAMLIRILKKAGAKKILLAGFDGFEADSSQNYAVETFKKSLDYNTAQKKNSVISKQLKLALSGIEYEFITPTKYEISNI